MIDDDGGFHERLDEAFKASGISQAELGRKVGASPATVSDWFNKRPRAFPKGESMLALPKALGVSGSWLFWDRGPMRVRAAELVGSDPAVDAINAATTKMAEMVAALRQEAGLPTPPPADVARLWDMWDRLQQLEALAARLEEEAGENGPEHQEPRAHQG